jgi:hypothetical protein
MQRRYTYLTHDAERRTLAVERALDALDEWDDESLRLSHRPLAAVVNDSDMRRQSSLAGDRLKAASGVIVLNWAPPTSRHVKIAAAGGSMAKEDFSVGDSGLLQLTATWGAASFKLEWSVTNFSQSSARLLVAFRSPEGAPIGPWHDAGALTGPPWEATGEDLGFSPVRGWELELAVMW